MKFRYIAIEGVIGVGKTTLVEALAERLDAERARTPGAYVCA